MKQSRPGKGLLAETPHSKCASAGSCPGIPPSAIYGSREDENASVTFPRTPQFSFATARERRYSGRLEDIRHPMTRFIAVLLLAGAAAFGQAFSAGVKGGVPLTDFFEIGAPGAAYPLTTSTTNRYIAGAGFEARLPHGLTLEFDVLYRHLNFRDYYILSPLEFGKEHVTAGDWEFPLLLKYHFTRGVARPYVSAGPALDAMSVGNSFYEYPSALNASPSGVVTGENSTSVAIQDKTAIGIAMATGLDIHAGPLRFSPEIRYTYWASPHSASSNRNQAEALLGISF